MRKENRLSRVNIEELKRELADDVSIVELNADPFPVFERLRRDKPLAWAGNLNMWLVTRFDDVAHVLDHPELFTAETEPSFLADVLGVNMLTLEGDAARRIKDPMLPPFTARGCSKQYIDEELEAFANKLIDRFADKGEVELMSAYAEPIATHSLTTVLGLDGVSDAKMWELRYAWASPISKATRRSMPFTGRPGRRSRSSLSYP